jgi:hypothetical protein
MGVSIFTMRAVRLCRVKPTLNYPHRRLVLVIVLTALAAAAGFVWGQRYGYRQGRSDVMKQVEQRLNAAPPSPRV